MGGVIVPEQAQLLVMYDLLHYMELHGERLLTEDVVSMLNRAHKHKKWNHVQDDSKLRYFERFKKRLRRIGVEFAVDFESGVGRSYFVVPNPGAQKEYVNGMIVMREMYSSSQWKHLVGLAREQGVSGLYIAAERGSILDERLSAFRLILGEGAKRQLVEGRNIIDDLKRTVQPGA